MNITASIVLYKTSFLELKNICDCLLRSRSISKLILVDNSPDDRLKNIISDEKVKYIFPGKNIGYGRGHNIAIKEIINKSKFHLVLNADISFKPDVIDKIQAYMLSNPEVGQIMPKIVNPDGEIQYLCKLIPTPFDMIVRRFIPVSWFTKSNKKFQLMFTDYNQTIEVPYLSGCFMFLSVNALKKVGLFDERFFMYPEDIDLTRRIHEKYNTIYYPEVSIVHKHAKESHKNIRMFFIHIINIIRYFNKWGWFFDIKRINTNQMILKKLNYNE